MKKIYIPSIVVLLLSLSGLSAQQSIETKQKNIFQKLAMEDSVTHARVKVHQDKRIESLMVGRKSGSTSQEERTMSGYRVQVFSSNTQRTAKNEAFRREKMIKDEFPDEAVYVNYVSPFWKVRVGDFRTQAQAQSFRSKLLEAFPNLRSEAYVVREIIIISGSK